MSEHAKRQNYRGHSMEKAVPSLLEEYAEKGHSQDADRQRKMRHPKSDK